MGFDFRDSEIIKTDKIFETTKTIKTSDGSIAGLHGEFLQRTDTGAWESAQTGVEYFSPDQQGGIYGKVIRQYFNGSADAGTVLIGSGVEDLVAGSLKNDDGTYIFDTQSGCLSSSFYARLTKSSGQVDIQNTLGAGRVLDGSFLDYTLSTPPSTSPSAKIQPLLDPAVLQRVNDGTWETAQTGVEYFSPDQCGGIYGKVIRMFFGAVTEGQVVATGADQLITIGGSCDAGSNKFPLPMNEDSSFRALVELEESTNEIEGRVAGYTIDHGWVDYTRVTPPATSPTGQPFADPSSPLYKRADTGLYELPQNGVEYISKNQSEGSDIVYIQFFGTKVNGDTIVSGPVTLVRDKLRILTANTTPDEYFTARGFTGYSGGYVYVAEVDDASSNLVLRLSSPGWSVISGSVEYIK